jgi:hypothetical protein
VSHVGREREIGKAHRKACWERERERSIRSACDHRDLFDREIATPGGGGFVCYAREPREGGEFVREMKEEGGLCE